MSIWPKQDFESMVSFYGAVGENQTKLILPYPMRLAWDTKVEIKRITCNVKVETSLKRIFDGILLHYGSIEKIHSNRMDLFGGCLNVRKVRNGNSWSIHSWGVAIDLDPDHNQLKWGRDKATMPEKVIEIFEDEGWVSLGNERNYDFMHFQAARL